MKSNLPIRAASLFVLLMLPVLSARAGTETILAKGFKPNTAYHVGEFDAVNTLNGDLAVNIPIGPEYRTNGTLKYQFNLHHFGNAWAFFDYYGIDSAPGTYEQVYNFCCSYSTFRGSDGLERERAFSYYERVSFSLDSPSSAGLEGTEAVPVGNAGMGWHFTTGEFSAAMDAEPYLQGAYTDSHGAAYGFHTSLHAANAPSTPGVAYSQDGSYLRLRTVGGNRLVREIDFPDGTRKRFKCVERCDQWNAEWHLQWTSDPFGNVLLIERQPELRPAAGGNWVWTFVEGTVPNGEAGAAARYYSEADRASLLEVRKHRVTFTNDNRFPGFPLLSERLSLIELAGPQGDFSMVYRFVTVKKNILRTNVRPWIKGPLFYPYDSNKRISVDVLDRIELPPGGGKWQFSYYEGSASDGPNISYAYCMDASQPSNCTNNPGAVYPTSSKAGRLEKVQAPTGGGYRYDYGYRVFPRFTCRISKPEEGSYGGGAVLAVKSRTEIDATGNDVQRLTEERGGRAPELVPVQWRYGGSAYFRTFVDLDGDGWDDGDPGEDGVSEVPICRAPDEFIAAVLDPNGLLTLNYYNARVGDYLNEVGNPAYGVPFSPDPTRENSVVRANGATISRPLSSEVYQIEPVTAEWNDLREAVRRMSRQYRNAGDNGLSPTRLRSTYATYEWSDQRCLDEGSGLPDCRPLNVRKTSEHMRYHDDGVGSDCDTAGKPVSESFVETVYSDFDGLGHHRQKNTFGNTRAVGITSPGLDHWDHRAEYTKYNPNVTYAAGQANPAGMPDTGTAWLIGVYSRTSVLEKSSINTTLYDFDPGRGYVRGQRRLKNDQLGSPLPYGTASVANLTVATAPNDFLLLTSRRSAASAAPQTVITDAYYGGDGGGLAAGSTRDANYVSEFTVTAQNERDYLIENTYRQGTLVTTDYMCDSATVFVRTFEAEIGPAMKMGLPASTADASGLRTRYAYDDLGRVTRATPPGGSAVTPQDYGYNVLTAGAGMNSVTVSQGVDGRTMTYVYDPLGRVTQKTVTGAGGTAGHSYTYSVMGRVQTEILPYGATVRHTYDPLGRKIKTRDGAGKITEYAYCGVRTLVTKIKDIASSSANEAQFSQRFDAFGRIADASDNVARAAYAYDAGSNVTRVQLNAAGAGPNDPNVQVRELIHDGRGVLVTARHPELREAGSSVQVQIRSTVDARGHVRATDAEWHEAPGRVGSTLHHLRLRYDYDAAERIARVWRPAGTSQLTLKSYTYYESSTSFGKRNQLETATRYNYFPDPARTLGTASINVATSRTYYDCANSTECTGLLASETTAASGVRTDGTSQTILTGTVAYAYDSRNNLARVDYPRFGTTGPARSVYFGYTSDDLTAVSQGGPLPGGTRLATISYHLTGIPHVVQYAAAGVSDTFARDGSMPRPASITWHWNGGSSASGTHVYDGAGNVSAIGADTYRYDRALRLVAATVSGQSQSYEYDAYGNLTTLAGRPQAVDSRSNRLTASGVAYDAGGNVTALPGLAMSFDAFDAMIQAEGATFGRVFVYDASDERVAVLDYKPARRELWTFRDSGKRVIRDFERTYDAAGNSLWSWKKDYVYRGSILSNTIAADGVRDVHVDHLGSVRFVTNAQGALVASAGASSSGNKYFPFGTLVFPRILDERSGFTGHERDDDGTISGTSDLDYMHARYYAPHWGRFLSVDRVLGDASRPQSWNRYAYARNAPVTLIDPDGNEAKPPIVIGENYKNILKPYIRSNGGKPNSVPKVALRRGPVAQHQFRSLLRHQGTVVNLGLDASKTGATIGPEMYAEFRANGIRFGVQTGNWGPADAIHKVGQQHIDELARMGGAATQFGKAFPFLGGLVSALDTATVFLEESEPYVLPEERAKPPKGGWAMYHLYLVLRTYHHEESVRAQQPQMICAQCQQK